MGCMAVGRNSHERWPSGRMQGGTWRKDSYIGHPLPFFCGIKAPPDWPVISLRTSKKKKKKKKTMEGPKKKKKNKQTNKQKHKTKQKLKQDLPSAMGIMLRARNVDQYPQYQPNGNREGEVENADQDTAVQEFVCSLVGWLTSQQHAGCPRGISEYAHGLVLVPTNKALPWKRRSMTLVWYVHKKRGHAQIDH